MWQREGTVGCDFQEREVGCWNREIIISDVGKERGSWKWLSGKRGGMEGAVGEVVVGKERWDGRGGVGSGCREREVGFGSGESWDW